MRGAFRRSGTVVLLMAPAAPVADLALKPSGLTIGRALILLTAALREAAETS